MKKLQPLTKSKHYVKFTNDRDLALQKILGVHMNAIDNIILKLKRKVVALGHEKRWVDQFAKHSGGAIRHEFDLAAAQTSRIVERLRAESYFLAHISECEAIGRALEKPQRYNVHTRSLHAKPTHDGSNLADRMQLAYDNLRRDVEQAYARSLVLSSDRIETDKRIANAFPHEKPKPVRRIAQLKPPSKRIVEARGRTLLTTKVIQKGADPFSMTYGFADNDLWDDVLEDYHATDLPSNIYKREPEDKTLFYDVTTEKNEVRYSWEVEQETTEDFVRSVRSGTQDAANENGIDDFEWVAVEDSATDECCRVRDGQSSRDIETALDNGKIDEDECDAIVPPAHFKCRCRSVPLTEDMPDFPVVDYGSFDDWIKSKGQES